MSAQHPGHSGAAHAATRVTPPAAGVLIAILLILAWAAVPLGSNRPWSEALLAAMILGLAFVVLMARLWRQSALFAAASPARVPAALLSAWAAISLLQTLPLPMPLIQILSPTAHAIWSASGVLDVATLSLDRGASFARGLHQASLAALFVLAFAALSNGRRLRGAATAVVVLGTLQALLGVAVALGRSAGWLASGPLEGVGGISGTFVNPNHFAGFIEMSLCVSVGLALAQRGESISLLGVRAFVLSVVNVALSARLPLLAAQVVMIVALLWSGSRGAVLAVSVALTLSFLIAVPARRDSGARARRKGRLKMTAAALAVAMLALAWGGPGVIADKFSAQGISGNRLELSMASASLAADFALVGAGAGAFKSVFPAYKSEPLGLREYEHAHNDYLEILAEGGILGAVCFFGAIAVTLWRCVRRARERRSHAARALCAGAVAACLSLLVHALFDFNLQIPANASLFVFVLAMCLSAAYAPRDLP